MTKLHQLLAVVSSLKGQATATAADLRNTFEKKRNHFTEQIVTFKSRKADVPDSEESRLSLQTTVEKELTWISEKLSKAFDVAYQIDIANLSAKADVTLENGTIILKSVPATSLLQIEHTLVEVQELVKAIPTLDPARGFEPDDTRGAGIFRARDVKKVRTEKIFDFVVMVPSTDKHPAQVKELTKDIPTGDVLGQEWSSLIHVSTKGDMLDRVEDLLRAVKKARSKANDCEIDQSINKIGSTLLDYVFSGKTA